MNPNQNHSISLVRKVNRVKTTGEFMQQPNPQFKFGFTTVQRYAPMNMSENCSATGGKIEGIPDSPDPRTIVFNAVNSFAA